MVGIGPHRVIIVVAGHDRERHLARDHGKALARSGHFYRTGLFRRGEVAVHHRIGRAFEPALFMCRIDQQRLVLPHIPERGDKGDVAARAFDIGGDIGHLREELFVRVKREAFGLLVRVIHVVLRVGDDGDGEAVIRREGRCGKRAHCGRGQGAGDHCAPGELDKRSHHVSPDYFL